jgi:hypothetical protein
MTSFTSTNFTTPALADQPPSDFDGDGTSDILWHNTNGDTGTWLMNSSGGFTPVDFGSEDPSWTPVATGDLNADGLADVLWRNSNGEVGVWVSNGGATANGFDEFDLGNVDPSWVIQGTGDFNGDSLSDILWRNTNGDTGIWYMSADGGVCSVDVGVVDRSWSIQGIGDFNGDNFSDILWRNTSGEVGYWLFTGDPSGAGYMPVGLGIVPTSWVIQGVGDFSGAGVSDILWRNTNGDTGIWIMNADGSHSSVDFGIIDLNWTIQAVGDYNGSGKAGILWRNANGAIGEWLANSGTGFTGFTAVVLAASVDPSWSIIGDSPPDVVPVGVSSAAMAHAMASMAPEALGANMSHAVTSHQAAAAHPMLATPSLTMA